jgi:hypothetical protein
MHQRLTSAPVPVDQLTRDEWRERARQFVDMRIGIAGARANEFVAGYVDNFRPVYCIQVIIEGESWYVWFVVPGEGKFVRVVNQLLPGVYVDHEGTVHEHDPDWVLVLGTVTRIGDQPLLTPEMFRR